MQEEKVGKDGLSYTLNVFHPSAGNFDDLVADCCSLIEAGGAINNPDLENELKSASLIAVIFDNDTLAGIGVIKRKRIEYEGKIEENSGAKIADNALEIGYIATNPHYQGKGLARIITESLIANASGPLFATTSSEGMAKILAQNGFQQSGNTWSGKAGNQLSLWQGESRGHVQLPGFTDRITPKCGPDRGR